MDDAIYFPILPAKAGEIEAVGHLSPFSEVRIRPIFDVPLPRAGTSLSQHLANIADSVVRSWGTRLPVYFDFSRYEPQVSVNGTHIVEHFFTTLRQHKVLAMPVLGPLSLRGPGTGYIDAVSSTFRRDGYGIALRMSLEDFYSHIDLIRITGETLDLAGVVDENVELILDAGALGILPAEIRAQEALFFAYSEACRALGSRKFRSIVLSASSIPRVVPRSVDSSPAEVSRDELKVWSKLAAIPSARRVRFGDYGVTFANQSEPTGPVIPPGRVRFSVEESHYLFKSKPEEQRSLCDWVVKHEMFSAQPACWGKTAVRECGMGIGDIGNATAWVARDTNMHIEATVRLLDQRMKKAGALDGMHFASEAIKPWLQESLT